MARNALLHAVAKVSVVAVFGTIADTNNRITRYAVAVIDSSLFATIAD